MIRRIIKQPLQKKTPQRVFKIQRNDECTCGSGKKFKHCHGQKN